MTDEEMVQKLKELLRELDVTLTSDRDGGLYLNRDSGGWIWLGYEVS